jgi:hypothetical protein
MQKHDHGAWAAARRAYFAKALERGNSARARRRFLNTERRTCMCMGMGMVRPIFQTAKMSSYKPVFSI